MYPATPGTYYSTAVAQTATNAAFGLAPSPIPRLAQAKPMATSSLPIHITPTHSDLVLEERSRGKRVDRFQARFTQLEVPLTMAASAATYLGYQQLNGDVKAVGQLAQVLDGRRKALDALSYLGGTQTQQSVALSEQARTALARLHNAVLLAHPADQVNRLYGRFTATAPPFPKRGQLEHGLTMYRQGLEGVLANRTGLRDMTVKLVANLLGRRVDDAKRLAQVHPLGYVQELISKGLTNPVIEQRVIPAVINELKRAKRLMGLIYAGTVAFALFGFFQERKELIRKRTQEWS